MPIMLSLLHTATAVALPNAPTATAASTETRPNLDSFRQGYCSTLKLDTAACAKRRLGLPQIFPVDVQLPQGKLFELSGLAMVGGQLLGINDKNDPTIYNLNRRGASYTAKANITAQQLTPPSQCNGKPLDWEGVVVDGQDFLVINEACSKVSRINSSGTTSEINLEYRSEQSPTVGNGFEAIALDRVHHRLYVIKERQPRMVYEYDQVTGKLLRQFDVPSPLQNTDGSYITMTSPQGKTWVYPPDAGDATVEGHFLYVLERNSNSVLKIDLSQPQPKLVDFVSFVGHNVDELYETSDPFGLTEGLAMDSAHIYISADNNSNPVKKSPQDTRSRLFIFNRPKFF